MREIEDWDEKTAKEWAKGTLISDIKAHIDEYGTDRKALSELIEKLFIISCNRC